MLTRRHFLKAAAVSAPFIISSRAFGRSTPSPNEVVSIGLIGLGHRCKDILKTCLQIPQLRVVAGCDCFKPRVDEWLSNMPEGQHWTGYTDFRKMIERENLDGVMVETTTHARAWIVCQAMAMGCDTYIEKPMCLTISEGRKMVKQARRYRTVTQVGTQQRSMPLNNWASDLVKNGTLGKVLTVRAPNFVGPFHWKDTPAEPTPDGGNPDWWDIWTNQAEFRPYHHDLQHGWERWWDYDGGGISFGVTGWGAHSYDQIQRGLGTSETGPVEVILEEPLAERPAGKFDERTPSPDETGAPYYHMVKGLVGPRAKVRMKYANGTELSLEMDADRSPGLGCVFVGEKGTIEINRDRISASDTALITSPDRPPHLDVLETQPHIENWIDCIKTRKRCNADIEFGLRSTTLCYLVNIARDVGKVGETLKWDPDKERFTNCDEGNKMLSRPRRKGYELPKWKPALRPKRGVGI